MNDPRVIVRRRFPTYEFVLTTSAEPPSASALLNHFLESRRRVAGKVTATSFHLRDSCNSLTFEVDGSLVPSVAGSNVYVRVHAPRLVWAVRGLLVIAGVIGSELLEMEELTMALELALALLIGSSVVMHAKIDRAKRMLEAVLPAA